MEDDDPWHFEPDLTRVPGFEFYVLPKGRELRLRWHLELTPKNIHTPTHVGQSMESRRGRSSVDPRRDREHVSNTNSEGTYCRNEPLHL